MDAKTRRRLTQELGKRTDLLADEITREAVKELPELLIPVLSDSMRESARGNVELFKEFLATDGDSSTVRPGPALRGMARSLASRGHPLSVLVMLFHRGHNLIEHQLLLIVHEIFSEFSSEEILKILLSLREQTNHYVAIRTEQLAVVYSEELSRLRVPGDPALLAEVTKVLRERESPDSVGSYSLRGPQQSFMLWTSGTEALQGNAMQRAAEEISRLLGSTHPPLTVFSTPTLLWAWCRPTSRETGVPALKNFGDDGTLIPREQLTRMLPANVNLSIAPAYNHVPGFRSSHQQAQRLRKLAERNLASPLRIIDASMDGALSAATFVDRIPLAAQLVEATLGALATDDSYSSVIRETARSFLRHGIAGAAEELNAHRNTVKYRLDRFRDIVGKSGSTSTDVHLSLELAFWFGSEVLLPSTPE